MRPPQIGLFLPPTALSQSLFTTHKPVRLTTRQRSLTRSPRAMEFPEQPERGGDDDAGRPPRKPDPNAQQDAQAPQGVVDVFGDVTELPLWVLLFLAALFAEHFRTYACSC